MVNAVDTARKLRWSEIRVYGQLWSRWVKRMVALTTSCCRALRGASPDAVATGNRPVTAALTIPLNAARRAVRGVVES